MTDPVRDAAQALVDMDIECSACDHAECIATRNLRRALASPAPSTSTAERIAGAWCSHGVAAWARCLACEAAGGSGFQPAHSTSTADDPLMDPEMMRRSLDAIHRVMHEAEESDDESLADVVETHIRERDERIATLERAPSTSRDATRDEALEEAALAVLGTPEQYAYGFPDVNDTLCEAAARIRSLKGQPAAPADQSKETPHEP